MVSLKSVLQFPPFRTSGFFWPEYSFGEYLTRFCIKLSAIGFKNDSYFLLFTALPYFGMEKTEPSLAVGYLLFGDTLDGTALISALQLVDLFI